MTLSPFRQLARETHSRLTGHWASALGILLLPSAVLVLYGYIAGYLLFIGDALRASLFGLLVKHLITGGVIALGILLFLLILRPMMLGVIRWWAAIAAGHDIGAVSSLHYFTRERYASALKYTLRLSGVVLLLLLPYALLVLLITLLQCRINLPEIFDLLFRNPSVLTVSQLNQLKELLHDVCYWTSSLAFFLLMTLFFADYRYVSDPDPSPIRFSFRLSVRCFYPALRLIVRNAGWLLLSLLVFPLLYTLPYLGVTYAVFCKWMTHTHA